MKQSLGVTLITLLALSFSCATAGTHSYEKINIISQKIDQAQDAGDKAQQLAYRARLYAKGENYNMAIDDYTRAIRLVNKGWLWNELGYTCFKSGKYKDAYNIAMVLKKDFPNLAKEAALLEDKSSTALKKEHLKSNPPEIVFTEPAVKVKSRLDVKAERMAKQRARASKNNSIIEADCREKWGRDYKMVEYCINRQQDAKSNLVNHGGTILEDCREKWGNDYKMVEYCSNRQREAKGNLSRYRGQTLEDCKRKWGRDYKMVEYCTKKQTEAKNRLGY